MSGHAADMAKPTRLTEPVMRDPAWLNINLLSVRTCVTSAYEQAT
jgi:hypothetical protein